MQAKNLTGGQELLCIRTEKVYDWIINEANFEITSLGVVIPFPGLGDLTPEDILSVTCNVIDVDITEVGEREDRQFIIDGATITLQEVTLQKIITYTITVTLLDGVSVTLPVPLTATRFEQVVLCAPEGTEIVAETSDTDCFVTAFVAAAGTDALTLTTVSLSIRVCQSILVVFPVVLELVADFCQPRDILPTVCPTPLLPEQCPVLFPPMGDGGNNG
ncbi:hypothetical protein ACFQWC_12445 [Rossellomorea sp. GCM10028870]|uniref:hypothetical protein n=1 Tax=Rossellomorea sp. GCM10028870 TaxID=3273426 RepID=UPI00360A7B6B